MKNKKGMTLVELIVSVVLVSVIIIFLFRMLIDLRNEENKSNSKPTYKITQTVINKNIQNVLLNETVTKVEVNVVSGGDRSIRISLANNRYLIISISLDNQVITVEEIDEMAEFGQDVILYERRQLPESTNIEGEKVYLGRVDDLIVTSYAATSSYKYDKILVIKFPLVDNAENYYWIEAYYPYHSSAEILPTPINLEYVDING